MRAAPAARSPCDAITPVVNERRAGVEPCPYERLAERGEVGGGRTFGSSRTPTPTAGGRRHVCHVIYCEIVRRRAGAGGTWQGRQKPQQRDVEDADPYGLRRGRAARRGIYRVRVAAWEMVKTPPPAAFWFHFRDVGDAVPYRAAATPWGRQ